MSSVDFKAITLALLSASLMFSIGFARITYADESRKLEPMVSGPKTCRAHGAISPIPDEIWNRMQGVSWHADMGCPARDQLRYLRIAYLDFKQQPKMGEMIVARSVAGDVRAVFSDIFCSRNFMIEKMKLIDHFDGSDSRSMNDNNTSGFNCRLTASGNRLSEHSFGKAIDINPVQNPYVSRGTTLPVAGQPYDTLKKRTNAQQGVIRDGDVVTRAFARINWKWGGDWQYSKDYQHFSSSGR